MASVTGKIMRRGVDLETLFFGQQLIDSRELPQKNHVFCTNNMPRVVLFFP